MSAELIARRNVRRWYLLKALSSSLALAIPTIVLFWQSHGLSMTEVMLLQAIYAALMVALEVPSGYLADILGRKLTIVIGNAALSAGLGLYCLTETFAGFLAAEMGFSIGFSFLSGAEEALIYDSLLMAGLEESFQRIWGRGVAIMLGTGALFCVIGGFLAGESLVLPFQSAFVISLAGVLISLDLKEPSRGRLHVQGGHFREILRISWNAAWVNRDLRWLFALSSLLFTGLQLPLLLYQPYMTEAGLSSAQIGIAFALFNVTAAIGSSSAGRAGKLIGFRWLSLTMAGLVVLCLLGMGALSGAAGIAIIFVQQMTRGGFVIFSRHVNDLTASEIRATVISVKSLMERAVYGAALVPMGWAVDHFGLHKGAIGASLILAPACMMLFVAKQAE